VICSKAIYKLAGRAPVLLSTSVGTTSIVTSLGVAIAPTTVLSVNSGMPPYTFSVTPNLPSGLNIDSSTGVISGTPSGINTTTQYTVFVNDYYSQSASQQLTLSRYGKYTRVQTGEVSVAKTVTVTITATVANQYFELVYDSLNSTSPTIEKFTIATVGGSATRTIPSKVGTAYYLDIYSANTSIVSATGGNSNIVTGTM
jgi:hypothetical protein